MLARYTGVGSGNDRHERDGTWTACGANLHTTYGKRTSGRMFRVQRECMNPPAVKDVNQVKVAIMQWEEHWKKMMMEFAGGAKMPDLWQMSALRHMRLEDVKDQMLMSLDEI